MTTQTAEARVRSSEALAPYADLLIGYDWPNANEHAAWVATAPEAEILSWAEGIRAGEQAEN